LLRSDSSARQSGRNARVYGRVVDVRNFFLFKSTVERLSDHVTSFVCVTAGAGKLSTKLNGRQFTTSSVVTLQNVEAEEVSGGTTRKSVARRQS